MVPTCSECGENLVNGVCQTCEKKKKSTTDGHRSSVGFGFTKPVGGGENSNSPPSGGGIFND